MQIKVIYSDQEPTGFVITAETEDDRLALSHATASDLQVVSTLGDDESPSGLVVGFSSESEPFTSGAHVG